MASNSKSFDAEYSKPLYCAHEKRKTENKGPFEYYRTARPGVARVSCVCDECGAKKNSFISALKEYHGGFLNVLLPLAASVVPSLLSSLFGSRD